MSGERVTEDQEQEFWPTPAQPAAKAEQPGTKARATRSLAAPPRQQEPPREPGVALLELAEPIFQYVCRLNRSAKRNSARFSAGQVRGDIKALLVTVRAKAKAASPEFATPRSLSSQWAQVEMVVVFVVDFLIRSSNLPFANSWEDLAYEMKKEMAGDEKFFDLLDQTLADRSEEASERLAIFYTAMGLGFTGFYTGQPEFLRKKMLECSSRIRNLIDADPTSKICPDAYEIVNVANLIESPGTSLIGIGIALLGLVVVLFIANGYAYRNSANSMKQKVGSISTYIAGEDPSSNLPPLPRPPHAATQASSRLDLDSGNQSNP